VCVCPPPAVTASERETIAPQRSSGARSDFSSFKVGIWARDTHYMLRRSDHLPYWDGENRH
jgi:hypothetical protein